MITKQEIEAARYCISFAVANGADAARVSLSKSVTDSIGFLNGELDKVTHSADSSIYIYLFADGKYGTFSTNRLDKEDLEEFILKAIDMVKMLGEDRFRRLPDPDRTAKDALDGNELGLFDRRYFDGNSSTRLESAGKLSRFHDICSEGYSLISEECEYSESCEDNYLTDSQGFEGRHKETCFGCFTEMTIKDKVGNRYSGFWWETSFTKDGIDLEACSTKALERAAAQIGPKPRRSGRYRMVVDTSVATRLIAPVISALNASSIQQKMSFLEDSHGKRIFPEGFTLMDLARTPGKNGSRLFDTEGVATKDTAVIENGIVRQYFVNTYMSEKMGIAPTVEDISRPCLMPYIKGEDLAGREKEVSLEDILKLCGSGVYVTGFNGGNCNPVTGDFSYGVEGFAFSKGKITHPVREMLITGNMIELWNNLVAAGTDARECARWQIPTLAFEGVSFSA